MNRYVEIFFISFGIFVWFIIIVVSAFSLISNIANSIRAKRNRKVNKKIEDKYTNKSNKKFINNYYRFLMRFTIGDTYMREVRIPYTILSKLFTKTWIHLQHHFISKNFSSGYCWHFAQLLKLMYGNGEVCWMVPYSHFAYVNENGLCLDICGINYPCEYIYLIPESYIPDKFMESYIKIKNEKGYEYEYGTLNEWFNIYKEYVEKENPDVLYNDEKVKYMINFYLIENGAKQYRKSFNDLIIKGSK